jgi:hypothetical protein
VGHLGKSLVTIQNGHGGVAKRTWLGKPSLLLEGGEKPVDVNMPRLTRNSYPSFNPGGQTVPPPTVPQQLLYVQVQPKHSIYVSSEKSGTLIVDAALSHSFGSPIGSTTQASELSVAASIDGKIVVSGKVLVGSTDNLLQFDLSHITPQMAAHSITLHATTTCSGKSYSYTGNPSIK